MGLILKITPISRGLKIREGSPMTGGDQAIIDPVWQNREMRRSVQPCRFLNGRSRLLGFTNRRAAAASRFRWPRCRIRKALREKPRRFWSPRQTRQNRRRWPLGFDNASLTIRSFSRATCPRLYAAGVPALNVFIKVVVGVAASISMLVILLAMYTTVTERTRQIGILKALGMSKTSIAWVIEKEAILVSVLGVIVGVLLTFAARFAVMRVTTLTVEIEPRWVLISLLVGLLGGSLGALYPALRAARQDAVDALSYE